MIDNCEQNVKYKPFEWADVTIILQFDFCPKCKYFESCYDIDDVDTLMADYNGRPLVIKGESRYISTIQNILVLIKLICYTLKSLDSVKLLDHYK